jgi:hypothetical protein
MRIALNREMALSKQREHKKRKRIEDDLTILEDFEINAPPTVSKQEAMKVYCLPEGTMAVCAYETKKNPVRQTFAAMKLYSRAEIRKRARERYGGLQGLIEERKRREEAKFKKDLEKAKEVFGK